MLLSEATAKYESGFRRVAMGPARAQLRDGKPYVTITSGGLKFECEMIDTWTTTEGSAVRLWLDAAIDYQKSVNGQVLYWRSVPEIVQQECWRNTGFETGRRNSRLKIILYSAVARLVTDDSAFAHLSSTEF